MKRYPQVLVATTSLTRMVPLLKLRKYRRLLQTDKVASVSEGSQMSQ